MMRPALLIASIAALLAALAAGCAQPPPPRMLLRPDVSSPLPPLPALDRPWQASQLLTVTARGQQDQLSVEVALQPGDLTLIAFTAWGSRLLTLQYDGRRLSAEITAQAPFLAPPQILADVLLVNWPVRDWALPRGWRLEQQPDRRRLWDASGKLVTEVRYPPGGAEGEVELINHAYGYRLGIRTLAGDGPVP
jgi:hypothetical protein